jgi:hypothetical protein
VFCSASFASFYLAAVVMVFVQHDRIENECSSWFLVALTVWVCLQRTA